MVFYIDVGSLVVEYYYMIGKTKSYIKKYFEERYTWLKVYSIEEVDYKSMSEEERDIFIYDIII